jgi:hypothetical protein
MIVYVCGAIALFTGIVAVFAKDRDVRYAFAAFCFLNLFAVAVAIGTNDRYAYRWFPQSEQEPNYRR